MEKDTKMALALAAIALGLFMLFLRIQNKDFSRNLPNNTVVRIENGVQIINLTAKGGFSPSFIEAQSHVPTELHVTTNGTYDCSSSLVIPSLKYQTILKPTGTETITLTAAQAQGSIEGMCGMGMYTFKIAFK